MFNLNVLQTNDAGDISLDEIAIVAQAGNEIQFPEFVIVWGQFWRKERYDALMKNRWFTDLYLSPIAAEAVKNTSDYLNLTGDTITENSQYPDGSWHTFIANRCDGQPTIC